MTQETSSITPELVDRAARGDRQAQQAVLEAQYAFVRNMLFRLAGPIEDLEDLQQTVLMRILSKLPTFRGESSFKSWVGGICVNEVKNHFRQRRSRARLQSSARIESLPGEIEPNSEHQVASNESSRQCQSALAQLSADQRTAVVLKLGYGYSIEEIAQMMGSARSTARLRLYYGRKKFLSAMSAGKGALRQS